MTYIEREKRRKGGREERECWSVGKSPCQFTTSTNSTTSTDKPINQ
jgi:predicted hydrocarbon binding protein